MLEKPLFGHFLGIWSLVFSDFWHKDAYLECSKHCRVRFLRKIFFWPKMPEICRKSPFSPIFIGLFPYILLFFHSKTLFITMPTIKHGSIVNKTDFWSRNFLKITGTADFCQKTVFLEFLELYLIFLHENLHTDVKWQYLKCDGARDSIKHFFPAENAGNMAEKMVFWHFLEISLLVFSGFLLKDAY